MWGILTLMRMLVINSDVDEQESITYNNIITKCKLLTSEFIDKQEMKIRLVISFYYFKGMSWEEVIKNIDISPRESDFIKKKILKACIKWDESHFHV